MRCDSNTLPMRVCAAAILLVALGGASAPRSANAQVTATPPRPAAAQPAAQQQPGDLRLRASKAAQPSRTPSAAQAREAFWEAFYAERYDAIPGVIRQLTAAYLENPRAPEVALLLAHTHLWKVAERSRETTRDPTVTDHLVLAEHYFEEAYRLHPDDHRIIGWLGSVRLPLGAIRQDEALAGEGARLLEEGVHRYPAFNLFTSAFVRSSLPASDPRFRDAMQQLWRNIDTCSGTRADSSRTAEVYELARRADPACANSDKAPHNFEGFVLNLGDMLVKAGQPDSAIAVYARARLAPTYAAWPYREVLEARIRNARETAGRVQRGEPAPMMSGSAYSCAGCHARR